jgi:glycosyltransferase involved in cell wall biosynthesis
MGSLPNHEVQRLMAESDISLLPSSFEGLPMSLLEAMAHGTVPVASHCRSGVDEIIRPGENGFLVPAGDIEGFADHIAQLHENPERMAKMAQSARQTIQQGGFTIDAMTDSYLEVMERIVSEPFCRPVTGMLPAENVRGLRSWLPPDLPHPKHVIHHLSKRIALSFKRLAFDS